MTEVMTRSEYVAHLVAVYRIANTSDSDGLGPLWLKVYSPDACSTHCRAIETILRDLLSEAEYERVFNEM